MKRILSLLLAATFLVSTMAACQRKPKSEEPDSPKSAGIYQDGTYSVNYAVPALDRTLDYLTVTVKGDEVSIDEYGCKENLAQSDETSSAEAEPADEQSDSSATEAEQKAADHSQEILDVYEELGRDLDAFEMEPVKGAEEHSYRFVRMMRTVLSQAKSGDTAAKELNQYADGSYESIMPDFNADGWKEFVRLTVKDGMIDSMEFNAKSEADESKLITDDPELNKEKSEAEPASYYPQIVQNYKDCGFNLTQLGAPASGAEATNEFKKLMTPLLASMTSAGTDKITASRFIDGTYRAQYADFDEYGWKETVTVKIKNGKVSVTSFDAVSKDNEKRKKTNDDDYAAQWKEKAGITPNEAFDQLMKNFESADNDVTKVDNVAGATVSSNRFKLLVGEILATTARDGNKKILEVKRADID